MPLLAVGQRAAAAPPPRALRLSLPQGPHRCSTSRRCRVVGKAAGTAGGCLGGPGGLPACTELLQGSAGKVGESAVRVSVVRVVAACVFRCSRQPVRSSRPSCHIPNCRATMVTANLQTYIWLLVWCVLLACAGWKSTSCLPACCCLCSSITPHCATKSVRVGTLTVWPAPPWWPAQPRCRRWGCQR